MLNLDIQAHLAKHAKFGQNTQNLDKIRKVWTKYAKFGHISTFGRIRKIWTIYTIFGQ